MTSTEIAVRAADDVELADDALPQAIHRARAALERAENAFDAVTVASAAQSMEDHYKRLAGRVWWASDAYKEAARVRLHAQRAVGEARRAIPKGKSRRKPTRFDWLEARRLRETGLSDHQIADHLGVSTAAIRKAAARGFVHEPAPREGKILFDEELNLNASTSTMWEDLAAIELADLDRFIDEAAEQDASLAPRAILRRAGSAAATKYEKRRSREAHRERYRKRKESAKALERESRRRMAAARGDALGKSYCSVECLGDLLGAALAKEQNQDARDAIKRAQELFHPFLYAVWEAVRLSG